MAEVLRMDSPSAAARHADRLGRLALAAPTAAAADAAVGLLVSLAREGLVAPARALVQALATELGLGRLEAIAKCESLEALALADVPAVLRIYAAALCPRDFLLDSERYAALASDPSLADGYSRLRAAVQRHAPLEHEALRAFLFAALLRDIDVTKHVDGLAGQGLAIHARIVDRARIVDGAEANDSLEIGRDLVVGSSFAQFQFVVGHEFGHIRLDASWGWPVPQAVSAADELAEVAAALPGLVEAAATYANRPFADPDPRRAQFASGLGLAASAPANDHAEYLHLSVNRGGGPIALAEAACCAYLFGQMAGGAVARAAFAYSRGGILHVGVAPAGPVREAIGRLHAEEQLRAWIEECVGRSPGWMDHVRETGCLGEDAVYVQRAMGYADRNAVSLHASDPTSFADRQRIDDWRRAGKKSQPAGDESRSLLIACCRAGDSGALKALLGNCADPRESLKVADIDASQVGSGLHAMRYRQEVAFRTATQASMRGCLTALRDHGVDLDRASKDKRHRPLSYAIRRDAAVGGVASTAFALSLGLNPGGTAGDDEPPLLTAAACGAVGVASRLLRAGAGVGARSQDGDSALHRAAARGDLPMIALLLRNGAAVDAPDRTGATPLGRAAHPGVVRVLLDHGASVDAASADGRTALMEASGAGRAEVVLALLASGASHDRATARGETALQFAAGTAAAVHDTRVLQALLRAGADVDDENNDGETALMLAARQGATDAVRLLIAAGATIDARALDGSTAMRQAADGRNATASRDPSFGDRIEAVLSALAEGGGAVDLADAAGSTPLIAAAFGPLASRVRLLLSLGADPTRVRVDGRTALDFALAQSHQEMIRILKEAMAGPGVTDGV